MDKNRKGVAWISYHSVIAYFPHTPCTPQGSISDDRLEKTQRGFQSSYSAHYGDEEA